MHIEFTKPFGNRYQTGFNQTIFVGLPMLKRLRYTVVAVIVGLSLSSILVTVRDDPFNMNYHFISAKKGVEISVALPEDALMFFHHNSSAPPPCGSVTSQEDDKESSSKQNSAAIPQNLHLAMIGDSLTRYMYLSLAHFLRWGFWECDDYEPSIVQQKQHGSWNDFFNYTNEKLSPYEQCDCWRNSAIGAYGYEHRYYWDPNLNNSLTVIQKLGPHPTKGHWSSKDVYLEHTWDIDYNNDFLWDYGKNWADIITHHLAELPQKPHFIIFNGGVWHHNGLDNEAMQDAILDALKGHNITGIYRTTTVNRGNQRSPYSQHDEQLCSKTQYCLNVSWTGQTRDELYLDESHFYSSVYNQMNAQLLGLLYKIKYNIPESDD